MIGDVVRELDGEPEDDDGRVAEDYPNKVIPPFDVCQPLAVPFDADIHEIYHRARKPDSSLDPLRPYTTPGQLEDLHLLFLGVWDKHHGF